MIKTPLRIPTRTGVPTGLKRVGAPASTLPRLSFYADGDMPDGEMVLEELEECALKRFAALRTVDDSGALHAFQGLSEDAVKAAVDRLLPLRTAADVRRDVASHHALRLAFCTAEDERRAWFLAAERALFKLRLRALDSAQLADVVAHAGLTWARVGAGELAALRADLAAVERGAPTDCYFRVPFEEALAAVARRQVLVLGGDALVPAALLREHTLPDMFRLSLSAALARATRVCTGNAAGAAPSGTTRAAGATATGTAQQPLQPPQPPHLPMLERLFQVLRCSSVLPAGVSRGYNSNRGSGTDQHVGLADIEDLAKTSFPLCMQRLHRTLVRENHLMYRGRLQYAVFLKELGVPMEDILALWRRTFSHYAQSEAKLQPYLYSVRHLFGKAGGAREHGAYSCATIARWDVGAGETHGCPFNSRQLAKDRLALELRARRLPAAAVADILEHADIYTALACGRYFLATHPGASERDVVVNSPNQYASASIAYYKARAQQQGGQGGEQRKGGQQQTSSATTAPTTAKDADADGDISSPALAALDAAVAAAEGTTDNTGDDTADTQSPAPKKPRV